MRGVIISMVVLIVSFLCTQSAEAERACKRERDCKWNEDCVRPHDDTEGEGQCRRICKILFIPISPPCGNDEECKESKDHLFSLCLPKTTASTSPERSTGSTDSASMQTEAKSTSKPDLTSDSTASMETKSTASIPATTTNVDNSPTSTEEQPTTTQRPTGSTVTDDSSSEP